MRNLRRAERPDHHDDADPWLPAVPHPLRAAGYPAPAGGRLRHLVRVGLPLGIGIALVVVVVSSGSSVSGAAHALRSMRPSWLALAATAEVVSYLWLAVHLRILAGHPANARRAAPLRIALVMFGLGMVMPAAPTEGVVMAGAALRRRRVDPRRIAVLLGCSQWFNARALFALASLDAAVAVALGDVPGSWAGEVLGVAIATLALLAATTWLSTRPAVAEVVARCAIRVTHGRSCPPVEERRARGLAWQRVAVHVAGGRRRRYELLGTTAAAWVCDAMCMDLALRAAGAHLSLEELLLAYTAGVLAAAAPFLPAGLGVVETVTPLILVHFGVHWPQAVAVVLVYRLIGTLAPAAAGLGAVISLRVQPAPDPASLGAGERPGAALVAPPTG